MSSDKDSMTDAADALPDYELSSDSTMDLDAVRLVRCSASSIIIEVRRCSSSSSNALAAPTAGLRARTGLSGGAEGGGGGVGRFGLAGRMAG